MSKNAETCKIFFSCYYIGVTYLAICPEEVFKNRLFGHGNFHFFIGLHNITTKYHPIKKTERVLRLFSLLITFCF